MRRLDSLRYLADSSSSSSSRCSDDVMALLARNYNLVDLINIGWLPVLLFTSLFLSLCVGMPAFKLLNLDTMYRLST